MSEQKTGIDELARAVWGSFTEDGASVVTALYDIAEGLQAVAKAIQKLGVGSACTEMGAVEVLSIEVKNGFERVASTCLEGLNEVAEALGGRKE